MTALAVPAAPAVRPTALPRLVRIELLKLTSTRLTYGLLATSVGLTLLWTTLDASRAGTPSGPAALTGYTGQASIITSGVWGLILAAVLGVTISSGEFRHNTATLTYLATPRRSRVLAAKAAAGGIAAATFGLAVYVITLAVGLSFVAAHGYHLAIGAGTLTDWGLGHLVGAALLGVIGVVLGSLVRSQFATVIGVFVWTIIIESLIGGLFSSARPYLPYTAATALAGTPLGSASFGPGRGASGVLPLPFAAGTALLAAIVIAGALIAARTTIRRDVT
jgi:ABC-type transport system involved in multi-copper enzyme maturation permease subunit